MLVLSLSWQKPRIHSMRNSTTKNAGVFGRPAELFPQIHAVRPNVFPDWQQFVNRYCGGHQDRWGNASGCSNETELYEKRLFVEPF